MNPLTYFSDAAADYAKYRPDYPTAAIDAILEGLGELEQLVAADIGAGTGIGARMLADRGVRVFAIEPNAAMREAAASHRGVEFREGTAEATNLADASVDLVVCFQAFHWFNREQSLLEFRRILKKSGCLALVWNYWELEDKFTRDYFRLLKKASQPKRTRSLLTQLRRWAKKLLRKAGFFRPYSRLPYFVEVGRHRFNNSKKVDLSGLIGRAQSRGKIPREGEAFEQLVADLKQLYERERNADNFVSIVYRTRVILAQPQSELK